LASIRLSSWPRGKKDGMDGSRFDDLARVLATPRSRRGVVAAFVGVVVAARGARAAAACPQGQVARRNQGCVCETTGRPPNRSLAACPAGQLPANGCCVRCPGGQTTCGGVCVDANRDERNCGSCGNVCPAGFECCSGRCKDLANDPGHCGGCRATCPAGQGCETGACCALVDADCTGTECCGGTFCNAFAGDTCQPCLDEGDSCFKVSPGGCCGTPGLQCLREPGDDPDAFVCHDPTTCRTVDQPCDDTNFTCCAGTYCNGLTCVPCNNEGDDCFKNAVSCCGAPGLQCLVQPGPDDEDLICHDPATCRTAGQTCNDTDFLCCGGLSCNGTVCVA
jgi:hypothetical protein